MKSPLRPLKNRKTRKRKKKKWRFQLQLIQGNGPFPYFLERLLVLVLASCLRRWMATVDASDRSMPPYSLDFHLKKKLLFLFMFHNSLRLFNFQKYFVLCIGSVSFPFNAVYGHTDKKPFSQSLTKKNLCCGYTIANLYKCE